MFGDVGAARKAALLAAVAVAFCVFAAGARAQQPGDSLQDCESCPEMVVLPAGSFVMGSPEGERKRNVDEGPQREVTIAKPLAVSRHEVTWGEYKAFAIATELDTQGRCWFLKDGEWLLNPERVRAKWAKRRTDRHPVVCVSWPEAVAYTEWLSAETGHRYRLLSEAEWEYAARAGTTGSRFLGEDRNRVCDYANVADQSAGKAFPSWSVSKCDDGHIFWAPVGSFKPNPFGLHDVLGNVWEWTADCWNDSYVGAPSDGSAWTESGNCERRVLRGGAFSDTARAQRSADRRHERFETQHDLGYGFRIARELE